MSRRLLLAGSRRGIGGSSSNSVHAARIAQLTTTAIGGLVASMRSSSSPSSPSAPSSLQDVVPLDPAAPGGKSLTPEERLFFIVASAALVLLAGLMSGLTLGLLSLDVVDMQVLLRSGTEKEKRYAKRIAPVVKHPHFLLVTLVLCNAFATETLPIFLDRLTSPLAAVALSMSVILLFGEVIPQAVCSRYGLAVGAIAAPLVKALMVLCFPIAAPLAAVLDRVLGGGSGACCGGGGGCGDGNGNNNNNNQRTHNQHTALFRRAQLKALVDVHAADEGLGGTLAPDEIAVIRGALDLSAKTAACCLTPLERVFSLPTDARLDGETLRAVVASGHSRVPVHSPGDKGAIVGVLLVKELLLVDRDFDDEDEDGDYDGSQEQCRLRQRRRRRQPPAVSELKMRTLPHLRSDTKLYDMLRLFETGRCHMAVLVTPPREEGGRGGEGGRGSISGDDDGDDDDDEDDDEDERKRRRRSRRSPTRDFSDDASDSDDGRIGASNIPLSLPSSQSRSSLAEVLCARGDRLLPSSSRPSTASSPPLQKQQQEQEQANGDNYDKEIGPAAALATATAAAASSPPPPEIPRPPSPLSSSSSSSSVEDSLGGRVLGIVTLEDVLEELIGHAILDETDRFEDRHGERRVNARALAASLPSHLRELLREHQIRVGGVGVGGVGGGGGGTPRAAAATAPARFYQGGGNSCVAIGGSRLLPPAARQAVIGNATVAFTAASAPVPALRPRSSSPVRSPLAAAALAAQRQEQEERRRARRASLESGFGGVGGVGAARSPPLSSSLRAPLLPEKQQQQQQQGPRWT